MFWLLVVLLCLLGGGVCQDIGGSNSGNEARELITKQYECEWESWLRYYNTLYNEQRPKQFKCQDKVKISLLVVQLNYRKRLGTVVIILILHFLQGHKVLDCCFDSYAFAF